jgi:hypothetical protein
MQSKPNSPTVQATALYNGDTVDILDVLQDRFTGKVEYMISYGSTPIWVDSTWLSKITWLV